MWNNLPKRLKMKRKNDQPTVAIIDADGPSPSGGETRTASDEKVQLRKEIGLIKAISIIMGTIIGSGIFISPQGVLSGTGSVGLSLVVWVVCGLVSLAGALCFAELSIVTGKSGSQYIFLKEAYGDIPAFLYSWTSSLLMRPGGMALVTLALGTYTADFVVPGVCGVPDVLIKLFAVLVTLFTSFINAISVKWTTNLHVVCTVSKVVVLLIISGVGVVRMFQGHTEYINPAVSFIGSNTGFFQLSDAFYQGLYPYDGWGSLSTVYEEVFNPKRNVPLAVIISIPITIVIYIFVNLSYLTVLSPNEMIASKAVALDFSEVSLGVMYWIVPLGICISVFGGAMGSSLTDSRLPYVTSREGHMAQVLSMISIKRRTPLPGIFLEAIIAVFLIAVGSFDTLVYGLSFAGWIFYGSAVLAVPILRYRLPDRPRPFKVPMIFVVVVFITACYLVVSPFINGPGMETIYACLFIFSGLIFYFPFVHFKYHPKIMDHITMFLQRLLQIVTAPYEEPD
ncbi:b(0,+)-type amino acid transporter 1-like isoform X2 [Asterias rubens]|uniref:b(0,+)-type amino acid transporter 1-like isoform X2 n=1 Tax=Asterias rubens TaxID=7604 RepID=UPI00145502B7|nr:b(0,+)-type amino acid transporter 1-like isoform X2 [Asterias rubens]